MSFEDKLEGFISGETTGDGLDERPLVTFSLLVTWSASGISDL